MLRVGAEAAVEQFVGSPHLALKIPRDEQPANDEAGDDAAGDDLEGR